MLAEDAMLAKALPDLDLGYIRGHGFQIVRLHAAYKEAVSIQGLISGLKFRML